MQRSEITWRSGPSRRSLLDWRRSANSIYVPVTPRLSTHYYILHSQNMLRQALAVAIFTSLVYLLLNIMIEEKDNNPLVNIGGKQVPLKDINKPHNVVIGGVDKPIPSLDDFPPLEPTEPEPAEQKPEDSNEKNKADIS